ncbi:hypothetical protein [Streptomyces albireticuli]|uniref:Uncharacterized protein n=1 Tax=Streptomyces albireticuli TaxID=1940 RepID=A0A2A2D4F8_9ACTN|nr:hypothetical protein [Streptomyces albireticuli]MCD9141153.1 hypothetical protein [Streptomyces albireticuli]MCD9160886.1 hypothetical protein [Streptomyces albireticuli]MCD9191057.1 hypothetical protein [Streptomyces albireticuli]PAU46202.1 hypothetical protein CK936_25310 [Streptomyces albireticuli]
MVAGGWGWFTTVASILIGQATVLTMGFINNRSQARREARARAADRYKAVAERRETFELAQLVEVNTLLRNAVTALHAFVSARRHYRSRLREDPAAPPETYRQPMLDASAASDTALDALRSQIGFILADDVRALADAAEKALTTASASVLRDEQVDPGALGARANAAYEALSARLRDVYATREPAVPAA